MLEGLPAWGTLSVRGAVAPTLNQELETLASLRAWHEARCCRLYRLPLFDLSAFCAAWDATMADEVLATPFVPSNCDAGAAAFFSPSGGTDFGILEDGGPHGENRCSAIHDG